MTKTKTPKLPIDQRLNDIEANAADVQRCFVNFDEADKYYWSSTANELAGEILELIAERKRTLHAVEKMKLDLKWAELQLMKLRNPKHKEPSK